MNDLVKIENLIVSKKNDFTELVDNNLNFQHEVKFAMQAFSGNSFLASTAMKDEASLAIAIDNVATIGLSLNPAQKLAYLVPRDGKVCLDISYIGLAKLATDCGSVCWVQAKLVHEGDDYEFLGVGQIPLHKYKSFSDRGKVIGVYCVAKTADGEYLSEEMSLAECHKIRNNTPMWKNYMDKKVKSCPWANFEGEMMKKTVVKRASKMWPKTDRSSRFDHAVDVLNSFEGVDFENMRDVTPPTQEELDNLQKYLEAYAMKNGGDDVEQRFLAKLSADFGREIGSIDELNQKEVKFAIGFISQYVTINK